MISSYRLQGYVICSPLYIHVCVCLVCLVCSDINWPTKKLDEIFSKYQQPSRRSIIFSIFSKNRLSIVFGYFPDIAGKSISIVAKKRYY